MSREWRKLNLIPAILLVLLASSSSARGEKSQADRIIGLHEEIEADRAQVRLLHERLWKDYNEMHIAPWRERSYPPNTEALALEITDLETWWDSDPRTLGLAPTFRFHLHNVGSKPITNLYLNCTFYLASGTKFGSSNDGLVPNVVQIIPPGYWMTVIFGWSRYSAEGHSVLRPLTVQAEIELGTIDSRHRLVKRITIPPKPQRLPSEAALR